MAACTTTLFETGQSRGSRLAERNADLMAQQPLRRRRMRTPEIFFVKHVDNSRLVKEADPVRIREMHIFGAALAVLFSLVFFYGVQHLSAIESSYRVESEKLVVEQLREENRQLRLTQAELTEPARIDQAARELGLAAPEPGQVVQAAMHQDSSAPALAQITPPAPPAQ